MTRLILAEVLAMLSVLRVGGDFVCKTFELTTRAMLQLCWLLHRCFGRFAVVKPIVGRSHCTELDIILTRVEYVHRLVALRVRNGTLLRVAYEQAALYQNW